MEQKKDMYPLKFIPIIKERIWGGDRLKTLLDKDIKGQNVGESWEISALENDQTVVENGYLRGKTLRELTKQMPVEIMGERLHRKFNDQFPLLIKFLDASDDLSIQVHPNDNLAKKRHNCFGKTEMWYVVKADENSKLIVGFNKDVTPQQYMQSLEQGKLKDILNYESAKEGDAFLINAGKIHAIGKGIVIAEIQQASDVTYRVYDFDRKDKDGKLRELHTQLALSAIDYKKKEDFKIQYDKKENNRAQMVACPHFITSYLKLDQNFEVDVKALDSFCIYICTEGEGFIKYKDTRVEIKKGQSSLVPAACQRVEIQTKNIKLLEVRL